jgi:hypothetical protein
MGETERRDALIDIDRRDWAAMAGLLLLTLVALWPVLTAGADLAPGLPGHDARTQWYPWRVHAAEALREGRLPLWNPYVLCGTPFLANFQSAVFYPPNLLHCVFGVATAAKIIIALHLWLSGVFTWMLCRLLGAGRWASLAGGIAFAFCAPQLLRVPAGHWGVSCAIAWLPLVLFCAEWMLRRPGAWAFLAGTLAVALQVLSGVPQYVLITAIAVAVYAALRTAFEWPGGRAAAARLGGIAAFFAVGACLAGAQLWPAMAAVSEGARSLPMRPEWARQFSLGPECLLTMLVPGMFGGTGGHLYWGRYFFWEMNAYFGVIAFALAAFGLMAGRPRKLAWVLGIAAGFMLLLALGRHTPVMGIVGALLPFGDALRGASKFLLPFAMAMAALAALGTDALLRHEPAEWRRMQWVPYGIVAVIVLTLMAMPAMQQMVKGSGEHFGRTGVVTTESMVMYFFRWGVAIGMVGALLFVPHMRRASARMAPAVVVGAMALDVLMFSWMFMGGWSCFPARGSAWPKGAGDALRQAGPGARTWVIDAPDMNDGMLERVATPEGIEPNPPQRFHVLFRAAQGLPVDIAPSVYQLSTPGSLADRMACARALAPVKMARAPEGKRLLAGGEKWCIVESERSVARAALYYAAQYAPEATRSLELTLAADPAREVVIESAAPDGAAERAVAPAPALFLRDEPEEVVVKVVAGGPGWLVLRDSFYPGWRAEVDGRRAEIVPADFAFRAVRIDSAGEHTVRFRYAPAVVQVGLASSGCAGLVCLFVLVAAWKGRRTERRTPLVGA